MKRLLFVALVIALVTSVAGLAFAVGPRPTLAQGLRPVLQVLGTVSCSSTNPCQTFSNASSGPGVQGTSSSGKGVVGLSGTASGLSFSGGAAVFGDSRKANGIAGTSLNRVGLLGISGNKDGIDGATENKSSFSHLGTSGVLGEDLTSDGGHLNSGVTGESFNGIGVSALSVSYVGANIEGGNAALTVPALSIAEFSGADLIDACQGTSVIPCDASHAILSVNSNGNVFAIGSLAIFSCLGTGEGCNTNDVDVAGNVDYSGQVQHDGNCVLSCVAATATKPGRAVVSYSAQGTAPTIEDLGEAQLVNGQAYVPLARDFANVIDSRSNYLVFITPEGDNRGLFVTSKTRSGFNVRESQGGRSTIPFSYRIVANQYGVNRPRLPMVTVPALRLRTDRGR